MCGRRSTHGSSRTRRQRSRTCCAQKTDPAAALVAIDPGSGAVRALVSYTPSGRRLQFNLATQTRRQAGSAFKPFVLATALGQRVSPYSFSNGPPELIIPDPRCFTNGKPWDVHNYADESAGYMNLLDATAQLGEHDLRAGSSTVAARERRVTVAHRMGITRRSCRCARSRSAPRRVNPLEMTDAYATLAARGVHQRSARVRAARSDRQPIGASRPTGEQALPRTTPTRSRTRSRE